MEMWFGVILTDANRTHSISKRLTIPVYLIYILYVFVFLWSFIFSWVFLSSKFTQKAEIESRSLSEAVFGILQKTKNVTNAADCSESPLCGTEHTKRMHA